MRPHFRKHKWILHPLAKAPFQLGTRCTLNTPSAVVAKFCRCARRTSITCAVSSARLLDGTIVTLTLVEG